MTVNLNLAAFVGSFEVQSIIRLLLSAVFGFAIGTERRRKGRQAGARTHAIVSVASCLIMLSSLYLVSSIPTVDAARLPAQVISGIGFLGAGTILITKNNQIKGLTTAAGLWACACMGIAAGCGFYVGAVVGFLITFYIMHFWKQEESTEAGERLA